MKKGPDPQRLDVRSFARAAASLSETLPLSAFPRLAAEAVNPDGDTAVRWTVQGELRTDANGAEQVWLHLTAETSLPLTCQRCMSRMEQPVAVDRWFRFARDEAAAAALDEEVDEDVLAMDAPLDLLALVEDELLMALPVVRRHETCPVDVKLSAVDEGFDAASDAKPHPFAALASLRLDKPH